MPPPTDNDAIDRLSRRTTLVRAGGLAAVALGASSLTAESRRERRAERARVRARARDDRGPVLHRRREGAPQHHRGPAGSAARAAPERARRVDLQADQGRRSRHLARERRRASTRAWRPTTRVGRTYLRGIQRTDAKGLAIFKTVYPGWYPGRAVHIHVKVHVGGDAVHTGQLFFRDSFTDAVYKRAPYKARGARGHAQRRRLDLRRRRQPLAARRCAPPARATSGRSAWASAAAERSSAGRRVGVLDADQRVLRAVPAQMAEQRRLGDGDRGLRRARLDARRERQPARQQIADDRRLAHVARVLELAAQADRRARAGCG